MVFFVVDVVVVVVVVVVVAADVAVVVVVDVHYELQHWTLSRLDTDSISETLKTPFCTVRLLISTFVLIRFFQVQVVLLVFGTATDFGRPSIRYASDINGASLLSQSNWY